MEEQSQLGFTMDLEGVDRRALLTQAALELDALYGHLGSGTGSSRESSEGTLIRSIIEDEVKTGFDKEGNIYPYKITRADFTAGKVDVPVRFHKLSRDFNFYELWIPFNLRTSPDWRFNSLEMQIVMSTPGNLQPIAYQILPTKQFQDLVSIDGRLEVRLNANFEFQAATPLIAVPTNIPGVGGSARADVGAKVGGEIGAGVGPFIFHWRKTKIDNDGVGTRRVIWHIGGAEFFQENDLKLLIIVQSPKAVKELTVDAKMIAGRYFSFADANFQQRIEQLGKRFRFIQEGAPTEDKHTWYVTLSQ